MAIVITKEIKTFLKNIQNLVVVNCQIKINVKNLTKILFKTKKKPFEKNVVPNAKATII